MTIQTIGFTKKTAQQFFDTLEKNKTNLLLDIRLNNKSQLSGFAKGEDLVYLLKRVCMCSYVHDLSFAPTKELLDDYREKKIIWKDYEERYKALITERGAFNNFGERFSEYKHIALLCSEPSPDKCHRRLAAEMIQEFNDNIEIVHL